MTRRKTLCLILALVLVAAALGSTVLCAVMLDHDCAGEACTVCRAIDTLLGGARSFAVILSTAVSLTVALSSVVSALRRTSAHGLTPVGLFVKLTE